MRFFRPVVRIQGYERLTRPGCMSVGVIYSLDCGHYEQRTVKRPSEWKPLPDRLPERLLCRSCAHIYEQRAKGLSAWFRLDREPYASEMARLVEGE